MRGDAPSYADRAPIGAMTGGASRRLLHDIGVLAIISHAEHYPDITATPERLESVIHEFGRRVSVLILQKWDFPAAMVEACQKCESWSADNGAQLTYADLVVLGYDGSYNRVAAFVRAWKSERQRDAQTSGRGTFVPLAFVPGGLGVTVDQACASRPVVHPVARRGATRHLERNVDMAMWRGGRRLGCRGARGARGGPSVPAGGV